MAPLEQTALQHQGKGISRTFVAVPRDEPALDAYRRAGCGDVGNASILDFYALTSAFVLIDDPPRGWATWRSGLVRKARDWDNFC